jgi:hypothetical protein
MERFSSLFKKEHMGELVLVILFIIYLIMGYKTPEPIAGLIDTLVGKIVIFLIIVYLFMNSHPILAVLALFVGFDLMRRSSITTGIDALQKFCPSEEKRTSQFTAYNQFPYTLEQEVVAKMSPIMKPGTSITQSSFKPLLDNLYDAAPLNDSN